MVRIKTVANAIRTALSSLAPGGEDRVTDYQARSDGRNNSLRPGAATRLQRVEPMSVLLHAGSIASRKLQIDKDWWLGSHTCEYRPGAYERFPAVHDPMIPQSENVTGTLSNT